MITLLVTSVGSGTSHPIRRPFSLTNEEGFEHMMVGSDDGSDFKKTYMLTGRCAVSHLWRISSDFWKSRDKKKGMEKLELRFIEFPAAAGEINEEAAASIKSGGNSLPQSSKQHIACDLCGHPQLKDHRNTRSHERDHLGKISHELMLS